jgi:hypothetical protein
MSDMLATNEARAIVSKAKTKYWIEFIKFEELLISMRNPYSIYAGNNRRVLVIFLRLQYIGMKHRAFSLFPQFLATSDNIAYYGGGLPTDLMTV